MDMDDVAPPGTPAPAPAEPVPGTPAQQGGSSASNAPAPGVVNEALLTPAPGMKVDALNMSKVTGPDEFLAAAMGGVDLNMTTAKKGDGELEPEEALKNDPL